MIRSRGGLCFRGCRLPSILWPPGGARGGHPRYRGKTPGSRSLGLFQRPPGDCGTGGHARGSAREPVLWASSQNRDGARGLDTIQAHQAEPPAICSQRFPSTERPGSGTATNPKRKRLRERIVRCASIHLRRRCAVPPLQRVSREGARSRDAGRAPPQVCAARLETDPGMARLSVPGVRRVHRDGVGLSGRSFWLVEVIAQVSREAGHGNEAWDHQGADCGR
jgi:hypothetical protein